MVFLGVALATSAAGGSNEAAVAADPAARIRQLREEVAHHDELYHRQAQPEISDYDYDQLKAELSALEKQNPDAVAKLGRSPVRPVGDDRTAGFVSYRHRERMLSLEKTYSEADLRAFHARLVRQLGRGKLEYVIEPKFDGLAISVTYDHGRLVRVATRGNGVEGDDVTANALTIRSLPHTLEIRDGAAGPATVEVRGECYMSFAEFRRINEERIEQGEPGFSSPRNLAAGTLKSLDPTEVGRRRLDVVFYGLGAIDPVSAAPASQSALLAQFRAWGLPTVEDFKVVDSIEAAWTAVQEFGRRRPDLPYPTDGAVVKLNPVDEQRELGATDEAPRWAIAYKFAPERATTRLKAITLQVGRTGVITPVAELEPVRLGGATIARATLHNAAEISRRDLRIGDFVVIERTGEVIPAIVGIDHSHRDPASTPYVFPAICPDCGRPLARREGEVAWRCTNAACPAQLKRRLQHFASAECVGIKGLGDATIAALVDQGRVHGIADLYRLNRGDFTAVPGRDGAKSSETVLAAIAASKRADTWRFVSGFGIPGVGTRAARALAARFGALDRLASVDETALKNTNVIGADTARAVAQFFRDPAQVQMLADLKSLGVMPRTADTNGRLAGKVIVLTGSFEKFTRSHATELIEAAGGHVAENVSRHTAFLAVGTNPGAKLDRAQALDVPVINEAKLLELLGAAGGE